MEKTSWIIFMNLSFLLVNGHYQNANNEHWMRQVPRRPVDVMTDVINNLGINILQQYHVPGNVAFSPTGLGFVLIALYEGSAGRGSKQIADCLQLPHDRQITRIGLRDIHRRLRSYLNADGFLGGLNLNKDNTRLRPEFEDILRFYGFDFTIDNSQMNATSDATTVNINDNTTMAGDMMNTTVNNTMMTMVADGGANQGANGTPGMDGQSTTGTSAAATTLPPNGANANSAMMGGTSAATTINPPTTTIDTSVDIISVTPNNSAIRQSTSSSVSSSSTSSSSSSSSSPSSLSSSSSSSSPSSSSSSPSSSSSFSPSSSSSSSSSPSSSSFSPSSSSSSSFAPSSSSSSSTLSSSLSSMSSLSSSSLSSSSSIFDTPTSDSDSTGRISSTMGMTTTNFADSMASLPMSNSAGDLGSSNELETPTESLTSTRMESTTFASRLVPTRSASFGPMTVTLNSRPSLSTLRSTTQDKFQTSSRILDSITSTMRKPRMSTTTRLLPVTPGLKASTTVSSTSGSSSNTNNIRTSETTSKDLPTTATQTDASISISTTAPTTDVPSITIDDSTTQTEAVPTIESPSSNNVRKRRSVEHYFSTYPDDGLWMQHLNIWRPPQEAEEATVRDSKQVAFLVNGCDVATVTAATYTAVLPFAYFPSLKAVAVEFPLDNPRYNVILFLPTERPDTLRLAIDLGSKSLRLLRKHLQPTWIRATIPSFMLKGFVTLTSYLQRLGIRDVFEPRAADLSPMTPDIGVYARDVQQSIGVNIRNYMEPDRTSSRESSQQEFPLIVPPRRDSYRFLYPGNGLLERAGPVSFVAEHPFLYFIIDTETTATLIAGRIDDPLNSRIL